MATLEREKLRTDRMKIRAERPRPVVTFFGNVFGWVGNLLTPVTSWWGFIGEIPKLFYVVIVCFVALVVLQFLKLFKRK